MRNFFCFLFISFINSVTAQIVTDNFSDGDFSHNPTWAGDTLKFIVNPLKQLQLYDFTPGGSCLSTPSPGSSLNNKEWRFYIRENFSPSGNNYGRVYLVSDKANLKDSLNGYFLQFGEAGNNDAVELFRQSGYTETTVCRGIDGEIAHSFAITVKVTRDSLGRWTIFVDPAAGSNYHQEATGTDNTFLNTIFFGVSAVYTAFCSKKFYWDDFYVGPVTQQIGTTHRAHNYDVQINEIMVKPNPPVNLPGHQYIELYNRTVYPIDLSNWTIRAGERVRTISHAVILPDSFLILTSPSVAADYANTLSVCGVQGFPHLTYSGSELTLKDDSGRVISTVCYNNEWYNDAGKQNGGWSLEQMDPRNPCGGGDNWKASVSTNGGTPGSRNSVRRNNPDRDSPQLKFVEVISPDTIRLVFNKSLDTTSLFDLTVFKIDHEINISSLHPVGNNYSEIILCLSVRLQQEIIYVLTVHGGIKDCSGNFIATNNFAKFAIPQQASANDVVFNEILFDPRPGGVKYVELYNRSSKVISLNSLHLSNYDSVSGMLTNKKSIGTNGYLVFPEDYILLSTDGTMVREQYFTSNPKGFIDMEAMPKMNTDEDILVLSSASGTILDKLSYSSSWQFPLLSNTQGVSLERIDFNRTTQDAMSWHSAAESAGFGTPAYKNSQFMSGEKSPEVTLTNTIFSPDNDGYQDILEIQYSFDTPGFIGNVSVYDSRGRLVSFLIHNKLLGATGNLYWDGMNENHEKAAIGIYLIYFEVFDGTGLRKNYRLSCVLAAKL